MCRTELSSHSIVNCSKTNSRFSISNELIEQQLEDWWIESRIAQKLKTSIMCILYDNIMSRSIEFFFLLFDHLFKNTVEWTESTRIKQSKRAKQHIASPILILFVYIPASYSLCTYKCVSIYICMNFAGVWYTQQCIYI